MPIFGKLIYLLDFSRLMKAILLNLQNGMRIQEALEVSKNVVKNYVFLSIVETSINNILIGSSSLYDGYKVTAKMNDFLTQHFAIIGNSGCGKSCGVASLIQNMFYYNNKMPINAHMVIFDVYGEYHSSLSKINTLPNINVKYYTTRTDVDEAETEIVTIPAFFLEVDDLALLLNVSDHTLLPILEKTLQ